MNNQQVKFLKGTSQQYWSITHNPYYFYFLTDTQQIYLGDVQLSNSGGSGGGIIFHTIEQWEEFEHNKSVKDIIYVYTDRQVNNETIPGIKIGDGLAYIIDLPFLDSVFIDHIENTNIHTTTTQKTFWNNKMNSSVIYYGGTQTLVFTKDFNN